MTDDRGREPDEGSAPSGEGSQPGEGSQSGEGGQPPASVQGQEYPPYDPPAYPQQQADPPPQSAGEWQASGRPGAPYPPPQPDPGQGQASPDAPPYAAAGAHPGASHGQGYPQGSGYPQQQGDPVSPGYPQGPPQDLGYAQGAGYPQGPSSPQGPGYPPPGGPGAPPPGGGPRRKGMPWWVWLIIAAVAVLTIGGIVVGVLFVSNFLTASSPAPPTTAPTTAPAPTASPAEPSPSQSPAETPSSQISGNYPLDDVAPIEQGPYWEVPSPTEWEITALDDEGLNQLQHPDGCIYQTFEGTAFDSVDPSSDRPGTERAYRLWMDGLDDAEGVADIVKDDLENVRMDVDYGAGALVFKQGRLTYLDGGDPVIELFYIRSFSSTESTLYASLSCPEPAMTPERISETLDDSNILTW